MNRNLKITVDAVEGGVFSQPYVASELLQEGGGPGTVTLEWEDAKGSYKKIIPLTHCHNPHLPDPRNSERMDPEP